MSEFIDMKENPVLRIAKQIQRNASQDKLPLADQVTAPCVDKKSQNHRYRGLS